MKTKSKIPEGLFCYTIVEGKRLVCPYWEYLPNKPKQGNGYCHYIELGDMDFVSFGLLWDKVKECGINTEVDEGDWE